MTVMAESEVMNSLFVSLFPVGGLSASINSIFVQYCILDIDICTCVSSHDGSRECVSMVR